MPSRFKEVLILVTLIVVGKMAATAPVPKAEPEPFLLPLFVYFVDETIQNSNSNSNLTLPMAAGFAAGKTLNQAYQNVVNLVATVTGADFNEYRR